MTAESVGAVLMSEIDNILTAAAILANGATIPGLVAPLRSMAPQFLARNRFREPPNAVSTVVIVPRLGRSGIVEMAVGDPKTRSRCATRAFPGAWAVY